MLPTLQRLEKISCVYCSPILHPVPTQELFIEKLMKTCVVRLFLSLRWKRAVDTLML